MDSLANGDCDVKEANDAEELAITPNASFTVVELDRTVGGEAAREGVVSCKEAVGDILCDIRDCYNKCYMKVLVLTSAGLHL